MISRNKGFADFLHSDIAPDALVNRVLRELEEIVSYFLTQSVYRLNGYPTPAAFSK